MVRGRKAWIGGKLSAELSAGHAVVDQWQTLRETLGWTRRRPRLIPICCPETRATKASRQSSTGRSANSPRNSRQSPAGGHCTLARSSATLMRTTSYIRRITCVVRTAKSHTGRSAKFPRNFRRGSAELSANSPFCLRAVTIMIGW